ncbi:MAG: FGGY-family carbohydrate kinase [Microbacteriaceae bacterium]
MSRILVAGVDVGTRSTKGVLVDAADGSVVTETAIAHDLALGEGGRAEHDAEVVWWGGVRDVLAHLTRHGAVGAVGLSSCGPCLVPVGVDGEPLRPGILYGIDTRAAALAEQHGLPYSSQSAWAKLLWLEAAEPQVTGAAAAWLTANGFAAYRLTGARVMDHHQAAYFSPGYVDGEWRAGERPMPALAWSSEIAGTVMPAAASVTGLVAGTPVVIGSSDGATDPLGAGVGAGSTALVRFGSTLGVTIISAGDTGDVEGLWRTPGNRRGEVMLVGGLSTGGSITAWMREQFARELPQSDAGEIRAAHAALVAEAAAAPAGSGGVLTLPYFAGERTPFHDPGARGIIAGIGLGTTRGELYRSALEGTVYGLRQLLEAATAGGVRVDRLRAVGGGVAGDLWVQLAADATGLPVDVVEPELGAPYGAARLAAEAIGAATADAPSWAVVARTLEPRPAERPLHDARYAAMRRLYHDSRSVIGDL